MSPLYLHRIIRFRATHAYGRKDWSAEANSRTFGALGAPHPHDFRVEVVVTGPSDPVDGFIVDLPALDDLLERLVRSPLNEQHLNDVVEVFRDGLLQPSTEALAAWIGGRLGQALSAPVQLVRVTVWESDSLGSTFVPD
jgi:6-pyruvoyltetrahydropterin/6-carboxytetrahydropterin synthase